MGIPYSIMNEHRDAFYHWHAMIDAGYIPPEGNYLLHIDHHDDMESGGYAADLTQMPRTAAEAFRFTDECLGIADFIIPAVFQRIFPVAHILKNLLPKKVTTRNLAVRLIGSHVLGVSEYVAAMHSPQWGNDPARNVRFERRDGGLKEPQDLHGAESLVLDVDLDYFCWDNSLTSVPEARMEITPEAYREYQADRDHPFRILPKKMITAEEHDGRYYLIVREYFGRTPLPDEERILKRIDRFFVWLKETGVTPKAIDICRSSKSGYLPAERAEFVEAQFMERLKREFDVCPAAYPAVLK